MNIISEIKTDIQKNLSFFSPYLKDDYKQTLRESTLKFLNSKNYRELEDFSRTPRTVSYNIHGKSGPLKPVEDLMNNFELYYEYVFRLQRLHYPHLLNVYLLGLFIFTNSNIIRRYILKQLEQEPNNIWVEELNRMFRFSAGSPLGEFYYRWRLTALCHDFGYPFELSSRDEEIRLKIISELNSTTSIGINNLEDLFRYGEYDLFSQLDERMNNMDLHKYLEIRQTDPIHENAVFDHGIYGALLFLRMMHSLFRDLPVYRCRDDDTRIVTSNKLLENSLLSVSASIAKHNLDSDHRAFQEGLIEKEKGIFSLASDPISYLLKLCDEIQEWNKFQANTRLDDSLYRRELDNPNMYITFDHNRIIINNIDEKDAIQEKLDRLLEPSELIEFV